MIKNYKLFFTLLVESFLSDQISLSEFQAPAEGSRARICKRLRSPGIDSEESILSAYLAGRTGTTNMVVVPARQAGNRFLGSLKGLQIRAQLQLHHFSFWDRIKKNLKSNIWGLFKLSFTGTYFSFLSSYWKCSGLKNSLSLCCFHHRCAADAYFSLCIRN